MLFKLLLVFALGLIAFYLLRWQKQSRQKQSREKLARQQPARELLNDSHLSSSDDLGDSPDTSELPEWSALEQLMAKQALPALSIELINQAPVNVFESKIGGTPYWPNDLNYPVDDSGNTMVFLAQINFAEITENLDDFPAEGILQFFASNDELYGLQFIDKHNDLKSHLKAHGKFRVIYHRKLTDASDELMQKPPEITGDFAAVHGSAKISFRKINDLPDPTDYRFQKRVLDRPLSDNLFARLEQKLGDASKHKLGGYASFIQEDPRGYIAPNDDWLLLFQLDTDANDHVEIMWGDSGIANFFIQKKDLLALNFDRVWYNWDCH